MKSSEVREALEAFSLLCDEAKACIEGRPPVPTPLDFTSMAARLSHGEDELESLKAECAVCKRCKLSSHRNRVVFGEGVRHPLVMVIGEGPGAEEDASGRPFVGRAGQYLDKWLAPIGLSRSKNVYIGNIVKCRPPENRVPEPDEIASCLPYLRKQIALLEPKLIMLAGATAAHTMLGRSEGVGKLRGETFDCEGRVAVVTYHPSGVLRNPNLRRPVWEDMKRVARMLNLPIRGKS